MEKNAVRMTWPLVPLADACEIVMGQSPPSDTYNNEGFGMPFFQGKAEFGDVHPIVEKWCTNPKKIARKNDILLSVRAPVGATNIANQECCIGRGLAALRFENYKYGFYFLRSKQHELDSKGTGTTFRAISGEKIRETLIPFPDLTTQHLIVSKIESLFSELDKAVESLKTAQQQLKTYRQSVLKWAFEGRLTNENVKEGELPEGWVKKLISEVAKIKGGKRLPKNHSYADERTSYLYIMAGNLKEGTVVNPSTYIHKRTFDTLINYQVTGGEVYITIVGACIGDAGIIPDNLGNAILTENAAKIIELQAINNKYLALYINSEQCQADIKRKILSATLGKLALNRIGSLEIPVPPIKEQVIIVREIESRLSVADKMEESITESLQQAEALRQSILKRAFEGRLV